MFTKIFVQSKCSCRYFRYTSSHDSVYTVVLYLVRLSPAVTSNIFVAACPQDTPKRRANRDLNDLYLYWTTVYVQCLPILTFEQRKRTTLQYLAFYLKFVVIYSNIQRCTMFILNYYILSGSDMVCWLWKLFLSHSFPKYYFSPEPTA
jgi:hypothetical protein